MKKISLISVFNNKILMQQMRSSAEKQKNVDIEYIMLDNTQNMFSSAAEALNHGIKRSTGDVVVFLHQDIEFLSDDVLEYIFDYCDENRDRLIGAAGVKDKNKYNDIEILSSMCESDNKGRYDTLRNPTEVFTLDECLIGCHKDCLTKLSFDEILCDGWHLYGADLCLQAIDLAGFSVYVLPLNIWHKSHGNVDQAYIKTQVKLAKKYKKYHKVINTANGYAYTSFFKRFIQNIYRKVKYKV